MSPHRIPTVIDDHRVTTTGEAHAIAVGAPGWFAWLRHETPSPFSYQTPNGAITIRPEKKRQGWRRYAYHATQGSPRTFYPGRADSIPTKRLRLGLNGCGPTSGHYRSAHHGVGSHSEQEHATLRDPQRRTALAHETLDE